MPVVSVSSSPRTATRTRLGPWLVVAGLLLAAIAYLPALRGGFVWDDDQHVTKNACLRDASGLATIWLDPRATPQYYPLVHTTFWLEDHAWGLDPRGYHAVNLLLHLANALLLGCVLRRLHVPGGWLAALLFAVHPVTVESVAWITERKNVLSTFFYLAAMLAWLRYDPRDDDAQRCGAWRWYLAAFVLFACALGSKTVTCSWPAAVLVIAWWQRGRIDRRELVATVPFFLLGAAAAAGTVYLEKFHVGAQGEPWHLSVVERLLIAGRATWFYIGKLLWPTQLAFVYPRWNVDTIQLWQFSFPIAVIVCLAALWFYRARLGRGPLAAVLLFLGTLTPALGFFDVYPMRYSFVADHFQYLACPAILTMVCAAAITWLPSFISTWRRMAAAPLLGLLAIGTWQQASVYRDPATLWRDTLAKNPDCAMACTNLANCMLDERHVAEALALYRRAVQLDPNDAITRTSYGGALLAEHRFNEAAEQLSAAVRLDPTDAGALSNLGTAQAALGRVADSRRSFEAALVRDPASAQLHLNYGIVLFEQEAYQGAETQFRAACDSNPRNLLAHFNLANSLYLQRRYADAIAEYDAALAIDPRSPLVHQALGLLMLDRHNWRSAAEHFRICAAAEPANAQYQGLLAESLKHTARR
ncbi:MAG TPA: tetratricopeptide repeat protein [Pirellulales bacterium]|jgi:tetratricopeptide (TPR) repeat protein|nr:tetratricopeptide repeat protein [Pirellulales bacterium]